MPQAEHAEGVGQGDGGVLAEVQALAEHFEGRVPEVDGELDVGGATHPNATGTCGFRVIGLFSSRLGCV